MLFVASVYDHELLGFTSECYKALTLETPFIKAELTSLYQNVRQIKH